MMNITSAQYEKPRNDDGTLITIEANDSVTAIIDGVTMSVPLDTDNRHYQAILDWVAEGNTIQDAS